MEANVITKGFLLSEQMHGVRYLWFIGDGDSSVYHAVATGVPLYSHHVQKVECANHAIKCYTNHLEELFYPEYQQWYGLSAVRMKRISHGACFAIKMHNNTGDVAVLRHDLQNAIQHYFGDH